MECVSAVPVRTKPSWMPPTHPASKFYVRAHCFARGPYSCDPLRSWASNTSLTVVDAIKHLSGVCSFQALSTPGMGHSRFQNICASVMK